MGQKKRWREEGIEAYQKGVEGTGEKNIRKLKFPHAFEDATSEYF